MDEVEFLESQLVNIQSERGALQQRVQELTRDRQWLEEEICIMRAQVIANAPLSPLPRVPSSTELGFQFSKGGNMEQELAALKTNTARTLHVDTLASNSSRTTAPAN